MAFSVIFRVSGQMSRFRGHFPPVSRFRAPLCRAGNSMEERLTAGSFSSKIFYQKCPCPRKCPNGHKSQICACFIGFCTKPPTKVRKERTKTRHKNPPQPGRPSAYLLVRMLPMAAMTAGETIFSLAMSSMFSRWRFSWRFMAAASSGSAWLTRPMVSIISLYLAAFPSLRCFFPKKRGPALGRTVFSMKTKCQPFFNRNFDKNACFLSPHCLLYSYKNAGCFLCRSSAWAPPGRTEEAA